MILFGDLYHLDVSVLKAAADRWQERILLLQGLDEQYAKGVVAPFDAAGWNSMDPTSAVARVRVLSADKEFSDAWAEAKGIQAVLGDAHDDLKKCQDDLHQLVRDAKKDGVAVSDTGKVSLIDPDKKGDERNGLLPSANETKLLYWKGQIELVLITAYNADQSAVTALKRNAGKRSDGFNDNTTRSIDQDEAQRAARLLKKYESGEKLSPGQLKELERVMVHNNKDPEFSRMVLNGLGPEGTLRLAEDLEKSQAVDGKTGERYGNIQSSLANNIATANRDREFSEQWRKDMAKLGTQRPEGDSTGPYGYQTLTTLLEQGDRGSYPPHMVQGLTDDIIAAERKNPDIWDETQRIRSGDEPDTGKIVDPVDDMLGIMAENSETATDYLDPKGGNDNLKYLLDDREWPQHNVEERARRTENLIDSSQIDPSNSRVGLGGLLQAATTGAEEGPPHTAAEARVMRDTINLLDAPPHHEEIPKNLRQPLGNALADYTGDTHEILAGINTDYTHEVPGAKGSNPGADGVFGDQEGAHIATDPRKLVHLMRAVSDDPEAYGTMHKAEIAHISDLMGPSEGGTAASIEDPARDGALALGAYDSIRNDTINDKRDDANAQADWKAKAIYHVGGAAITGVPYIGDTAQRILDTWTWDVSNQEKGKNGDDAAADVADHSFESEREMTFIIDTWADAEHGGPGTDDKDIKSLKREMLGDHNARRDKTDEWLGN
ncbi:hypothetical protein [Streptomyces cavernicola]|uniref:Uncharacterized protein n=1 Tax=Streptomyces cavernicola TaxID=3043613 RepID=A0ABT6SKF4_9ACTN|nr:hypothetical protein [Streptomyces sp. B-S-A6]MDI3408394.1 hypothetical protein [Streptomyces sp. B-S-A6]